MRRRAEADASTPRHRDAETERDVGERERDAGERERGRRDRRERDRYFPPQRACEVGQCNAGLKCMWQGTLVVTRALLDAVLTQGCNAPVPPPMLTSSWALLGPGSRMCQDPNERWREAQHGSIMPSWRAPSEGAALCGQLSEGGQGVYSRYIAAGCGHTSYTGVQVCKCRLVVNLDDELYAAT